MYYPFPQTIHAILFPLLVVVATQLLFICNNVSSLNLTNTYLHHKCLDREGYYKSGSAYESELKSFIRSTSNTSFYKGFLEIGRSDDHMNLINTIVYQCRGDFFSAKCRPCYDAAMSEFFRRCSRNKGGIIWFDQCFVEITTLPVGDSLPLKLDYDNIFYVHNRRKVSGDVKLFNKETMAFLEKLTLKANDKNNKDNDELALYAAGEKRIGTKKLYAIVQCTRFLFMPKMCKLCLETMIREHFFKCCNGRQGGRVLSTSCNFRYEIYNFLQSNKTVL